MDYFVFGSILWACYLLAEQQTIALLMVIRGAFTAAVTSLYITIICIVISSGTLRYVYSFINYNIKKFIKLIYFIFMVNKTLKSYGLI